MEIMTQRVEFLAARPGLSREGELTVIITIRPDPATSFRPHNLAVSRPQAVRLFKSLRTALRQSTGLLLISFALASAAGCSAEVDVVAERSAEFSTRPEAATATEQRRAAIAVRLLDHQQLAPVEERPLEPAKEVEVTGNANFVIVVDGDLTLEEPNHDDQSAVGGKDWNTKIPWPSQIWEAGLWLGGCYLAVWGLVATAVAMMVANLGRLQGGPLLPVVFLLAGAAVLLQSLPLTDCGLQLLPLPPWSYTGWLSFSISLVCWGTILFAAYVAVSGCLDAPQVFAAVCLFAMSLNALLSFSQAAKSESRPHAAAFQRVEASF